MSWQPLSFRSSKSSTVRSTSISNRSSSTAATSTLSTLSEPSLLRKCLFHLKLGNGRKQIQTLEAENALFKQELAATRLETEVANLETETVSRDLASLRTVKLEQAEQMGKTVDDLESEKKQTTRIMANLKAMTESNAQLAANLVHAEETCADLEAKVAHMDRDHAHLMANTANLETKCIALEKANAEMNIAMETHAEEQESFHTCAYRTDLGTILNTILSVAEGEGLIKYHFESNDGKIIRNLIAMGASGAFDTHVNSHQSFSDQLRSVEQALDKRTAELDDANVMLGHANAALNDKGLKLWDCEIALKKCTAQLQQTKGQLHKVSKMYEAACSKISA